MKLKLFCIIFIIITQFFYAQETAVDDIARKQLTAQRISAPKKGAKNFAPFIIMI